MRNAIGAMMLKPAEDDFELKITIKPLQEEGPSVSIHWEDAPEIEYDWADSDQVWTKISNALHGFLAEIGPHPEQGYDITFSCKNFEHLIEPITREQYYERNKASNSDA